MLTGKTKKNINSLLAQLAKPPTSDLLSFFHLSKNPNNLFREILETILTEVMNHKEQPLLTEIDCQILNAAKNSTQNFSNETMSQVLAKIIKRDETFAIAESYIRDPSKLLKTVASIGAAAALIHLLIHSFVGDVVLLGGTVAWIENQHPGLISTLLDIGMLYLSKNGPSEFAPILRNEAHPQETPIVSARDENSPLFQM